MTTHSEQKPNVRKFLDLSTSHLPQRQCTFLKAEDGVIAYELEHGWLMWVPNDEALGTENVFAKDEHIKRVQLHARSLDCDYVLFDRDGPVDDDLPTWEW